MNDNENDIKASWLQVSDLHIFEEADTTFMLEDYKELAKIISPQFIVVTGDYRNQKYKTDFSLAKQYLEEIIGIFNIDKKDIFFVAGNHDVNYKDEQKDNIPAICLSTDQGDYNIYSKYALEQRFTEYDQFIREFYKDGNINDSRIIKPSRVQCILWNDMLNIILVNTALISDADKNHGQIIDINGLAECKINPYRPTIILGHHGEDALYSCHYERLKGFIARRKVSAYLHGDIHRYLNQPISKIDTPNQTIPSIACAKSAPESGDTYSDIGVIYYEWKKDDKTYVYAYKWSTSGFMEDPAYKYGIKKIFYFPMIYEHNNVESRTQELYEYIKEITKNYSLFMKGKWVEEAEEIWKTEKHEGIGRCLFTFYVEQTVHGEQRAYQRAREIYRQLIGISNCENKTKILLEEAKSKLDLR